ncbi:MAG: peptidoglycan DD-metalloendopeptidase family protein [Candidatus Stahlbacteria bacterium]|nr:peptidoglycan DD-metalloendopeptidase family protein [Candidatus Stahlbacteria bacterium]
MKDKEKKGEKVCMLILILLPFILIATDNKTQLEKVKKELAIKKKEVKELQQKEKSVLGELDQINRKISKSKAKLKELRTQEKGVMESIKMLGIDGKRVDNELDQQENFMADKVKFMYQYSLTSVAPQFNPTLSRTAFYMQRMLAQDINWHNKLTETKSTITTEEIEEKDKLAQLIEIKSKVEKEQQEILTQSAKKEQLLKSVKKEKEQKTKLVAELEKSRADLEKLIAGVKKYTTKELGTIMWPVQGEIINRFGTTIDPKFGTQLVNKGIDIRASYGTSVIAIGDGKVVYEGTFLGYGKIILLDHQNGFCTLYGYLSETLVTKEDKVAKGQTIGKVGTGGLIDETVLHFELRKNGIAVDPLQWLK